jgi:hypothetical protein
MDAFDVVLHSRVVILSSAVFTIVAYILSYVRGCVGESKFVVSLAGLPHKGSGRFCAGGWVVRQRRVRTCCA